MNNHGQWEVVPIYEAKAANQRLIGTRFVDVNKGDSDNPDVRSRLVAQDTRSASSIQGNSSVETFAATPPLEGLRLLFALHMTHSQSLESHVLSFLDIKKAHLLPLIDRDVYLRLPPEAGLQEGMCAKLKYSLYGLRDAGRLFDDFMESIFRELGFRPGVYSTSVYFHPKTKLRVFKYGDDLVCSGARGDINDLVTELSQRMTIKVRMTLGLRPDLGDVKEASILNRIVRLASDPAHGNEVVNRGRYRGQDGGWRLELEADPRHIEILANQVGLDRPGTKGVVSPGLKRTILSADSPELPTTARGVYRSAAMRANYLAHDRLDIQFACKELARHMNSPRAVHFEELKRLVRYLLHAPRLIMSFPREAPSSTLIQLVDSDWAGCLDTRRSTGCSVAMLGSACLMTTSTTQSLQALSSGEAEFYSSVRGASLGLGLVSLAADFGVVLKLRLRIDASASIGVCNRKGAGRIRHIATRTLWLQHHVARGAIEISKIEGTVNSADLGTKHLDGNKIGPLLQLVNMRTATGRPKGAPKTLLV